MSGIIRFISGLLILLLLLCNSQIMNVFLDLPPAIEKYSNSESADTPSEEVKKEISEKEFLDNLIDNILPDTYPMSRKYADRTEPPVFSYPDIFTPPPELLA